MMTETEVLVLASENAQPWAESDWQFLWQRLPAPLQQQALRFRRWEDRQAAVLGKHLLMEGLIRLGYAPNLIHSLQWDSYKRPFLMRGLDFNISHTTGLVVCALQRGGRLGIDVEARRAVKTEGYRRVFTSQEYELISRSPDPVACFYGFWTRKEALMKADGRGFYLSPHLFEAITDEVEISGSRWHLKNVPLPGDFVCHLALAQEAPINVQFVTVNINHRRTSYGNFTT
jgi:4'-phosphopantetheinyl transferase